MKHNHRNLSFILLVLLIASLYVAHNKAIIPFVMKIIHTNFFTGAPELGGQATAISNHMTAMASIHCKTFIKQRLNPHESATFPQYADKAWNIGFGRYLIHSYVDTETPEGASQRKNYLCKIKHNGNDETDPGNWTFIGVDLKPASPTGS